jgi:hypothetical protein
LQAWQHVAILGVQIATQSSLRVRAVLSPLLHAATCLFDTPAVSRPGSSGCVSGCTLPSCGPSPLTGPLFPNPPVAPKQPPAGVSAVGVVLVASAAGPPCEAHRLSTLILSHARVSAPPPTPL